MHFHIITLFPESLDSYINASILRRAQESGAVEVSVYNIRDYTEGKHQVTDERPFGGGPGMVLKALPILKAVEETLSANSKFPPLFARHERAGKISNSKDKERKIKIIITSPNGKKFTNTDAKEYAETYTDIVLIAGRYEGIDARVQQVLQKKYDVEEISIGDFVLTGGELPALVIVDATIRHLEGVLGNEESLEEMRTASSEMYTRPEVLEWDGEEHSVPEVLRSGNHAEIEKWRTEKKNNK